ncbi:MAG: tetratricopeptide repeat protein [Bacteroidota bacterium]
MFLQRLFLIVCILFPLYGKAQDFRQQLDSLEDLKHETVGVQQLEVILKLAEGYRAISPEKAMGYAKEGYLLAMASDNMVLQARAFDILGKLHLIQGHLLAARDCYTKGLNIAKNTGDDMLFAVISNSAGILMQTLGDYEQALVHYNHALDIYDREQILPRKTMTMSNIGYLLERVGRYQQSIDILEEALVIVKSAPKPSFRAISVLSANLGVAHESKGDYEMALTFYEQSLEIKQRLKNPDPAIGMLANIFGIYSTMGNLPLAEQYYQQAWQLALQNESASWQQDLLSRYAGHLESLGRVKEATNLYDQSLGLAKQLQDQEATIQLLKKLAELKSAEGDFKRAYYLQTEFERYQDSLHNIRMNEKIDDLEQRFELERRLENSKQELSSLQSESSNRQVQLYLSLVAVFLTILGIIALLSRYQIKQKAHLALSQQHTLLELKNQEIQSQNSLLAEQSQSIRTQNRLLQQSNADLEQFAYAASHDLREPLRTIRAYMQLLEKRYAPKLDEPALEFIHFAADGAARMDELLQDLLKYSRIGRSGLQPERINLDQVLQKVVRNLDKQIMDTQAVVSISPMPEIEGYEAEINLLFQNLISNAIKFHRKGVNPEIKVSVSAMASNYLFRISDNGIGIPAEFKDAIFTLFQRLHARNEYEGTGIGLALCKKVVKSHLGEIWLDPAVTEGTTFCIQLPRPRA